MLQVICYLIRALGLIGKTTGYSVSELKRDIESWDLGYGYTLSFEQNCTSVDTNSVSELGSGRNHLRPQPQRGLLWNPRIHRSQDQERKEEATVLCASWAFKGVTYLDPQFWERVNQTILLRLQFENEQQQTFSYIPV